MLNCRVFSFYQLRNEGNERGKAIPGFSYLPFKFEPHPPLHLEKSPRHSALSGSKALTAVAGTSPLCAPYTAHPPRPLPPMALPAVLCRSPRRSPAQHG